MGKFSNQRTECPLCGSSRGFASFEDENGGFCHSCQKLKIEGRVKNREHHSYTPFASNEIDKKTLPLSFLYKFEDFSQSDFSKYYSALFGQGFEWHCKNFFSLRSDKHGALIIPYIDYNGELRTIKTILYGSDGHRNKKGLQMVINGEIKSFPSIFGYRYKRENGFDFLKSLGKKLGYFQCLYNEFYLNPNHRPFDYDLELGHSFGTPVILVESEKTVIICSYFFPQFIFIATGGLSGLTEAKAKVLSNRRVYVCFDNEPNAQEKALKAVTRLNRIGTEARVFNLFADFDIPAGYDIADCVEYLFKKGKLSPCVEVA